MYKKMLQPLFRLSSFPVYDYGFDGWKITDGVIRELRELSYFDQWKACIENSWYNVRLEDHSLFVFNDSGEPSYSYIQAPVVAETFRGFLNRQGFDYSQRNRSEFLDDYELELGTAGVRLNVTPFRYDVDGGSYMQGRHPKAHLHIGLDNQVRLALRREMTPLSFSLFVMRQAYPDCWSKLMEKSDQICLRKIVRDGLKLVGEEYWMAHDQIELHLV
ncbi:DUF2290 domain-containing protein [Uliginosibacterium sp. 31-16]|uniref:DUF2290 domain-containing protein n=1 Tax=Uliginosibacterium sp. 31-16 TaxID=3068315 RepID=UPI00273EBC87|nr:DUF2290 domain-containing protein [Uliginosibacterium sp. 31-16]MDP5239650.1 DUF2290 domain-containing protein [Uliginosibacterium sp. 31-16]